MIKFCIPGLLFAAMLLFACNNQAPKPVAHIQKSDFGTLPDGRKVDLYSLSNQAGMTVRISTYGGAIVSLTAPDRQGKYEDVVLGCDSLAGYLRGTPYFGALIGRYGNRIAKGKFKLDGQTYTLAVNNIGNHLHGGLQGFDKVLWEANASDGEEPALRLSYTSPDGEEGYPGTLSVMVVYTLQKDNTLKIDYTASAEKPTVVNLTNHAYFNLSARGGTPILDHVLTLNAAYFLPVDSTLIPTGALQPVGGTPFDFTQPTAIGARIADSSNVQLRYGRGYDHAWVLGDTTGTMKQAAAVLDPGSGRYMEVFTTEPAIQFYSGNFLDGTVHGKGGVVYPFRSGFCLETEHFPDSPNHPAFPSTVLRPGQAYHSETRYRFSAR